MYYLIAALLLTSIDYYNNYYTTILHVTWVSLQISGMWPRKEALSNSASVCSVLIKNSNRLQSRKWGTIPAPTELATVVYCLCHAPSYANFNFYLFKTGLKYYISVAFFRWSIWITFSFQNSFLHRPTLFLKKMPQLPVFSTYLAVNSV